MFFICRKFAAGARVQTLGSVMVGVKFYPPKPKTVKFYPTNENINDGAWTQEEEAAT